MTVQLLAARLALAALCLAALFSGVAVAGVRLELIAYPAGLTIMVPAVALGLIALALAIVWLARALKRNEGSGRRMGMIALAGSIALLWSPLHALYAGLNTLPVNDATTNPDNPPGFVTLAKRRAPGMNSPIFDGGRRITYQGESGTVSYMLHEYYPALTKPAAAFISPTRAFWRNFETAKRMGWVIVDYNEKQGRIEATSSSFWFGRVSDIVLRIEPAGSQGSRVDARAQSESDDKDFGRDIALLKAYFRELSGG